MVNNIVAVQVQVKKKFAVGKSNYFIWKYYDNL